MKNFLVILCTVFLIACGGSKDAVKHEELPPPPSSPDEAPVFRIVEKMPEFPGGRDSLFAYLARNLSYPEVALENNVEGTVYARFVVDEEGKIGDIEILRSPHELLSEEAIRVIKSMPDWIPGEQRGEAVKVSYLLPVRFRLTDGDEQETEKE